MSIRIITDSTCDIPMLRSTELGIDILPLTVSFGDDNYRDGIDISPAKFYEMLAASKSLPITSQVNPAAFMRVFEEASAMGEDILVVTLASQISGTYQSACIAKEQYEGSTVCIVDSGSATVGLASLVYKAIEMREQGSTVTEIAEKLEEMKQHLVIYACVETLTYLHKGGRLSAAGAVVGGLLNIKPVIEVRHGALAVIYKAKGSKAAVRWMLEHVYSDGVSDIYPIGFVHSAAPKRAEEIKADFCEKYPSSATFTQDLGAVLGTHVGPGAVGISIFTK